MEGIATGIIEKSRDMFTYYACCQPLMGGLMIRFTKKTNLYDFNAYNLKF